VSTVLKEMYASITAWSSGQANFLCYIGRVTNEHRDDDVPLCWKAIEEEQCTGRIREMSLTRSLSVALRRWDLVFNMGADDAVEIRVALEPQSQCTRAIHRSGPRRHHAGN
jgi:hypothetical protein